MADKIGNENGLRLKTTDIQRIEDDKPNLIKKSKINENNSSKTKRDRNDDHEETLSSLLKQLEEERNASKDVREKFNKLNNSVNELQTTIITLNETINNLQKENSKLVKKILSQTAKNSEPENSEMQFDDEISENENDATIVTDSNQTNELQDKKHKNLNENSTKNENNFLKVKRSYNITPIDIWSKERNTIQRIISTHIKKNSCTFTSINRSKFRINASDKEVREQIIQLLKERNIQYNTYTPKDEKMINVLLKGCETNEIAIIEETLQNNNIQPHKIQKFTTGYMRQNKTDSNIWQIILKPNTNTNKLFEIKTIDYWSVKWEYMKKPKLIQCKRCQRYRHSASNCTLPYRCVKCLEPHEPGNCPSNTSKNTIKPVCVNCKGEHTANNIRECPVYKRTISLKTTTNSEATSKRNNYMQKLNSNTSSYADILKNKQHLGISNNNNKQIESITQPNKNNSTKENKTNITSLLNALINSQNKIIEYIKTHDGFE